MSETSQENTSMKTSPWPWPVSQARRLETSIQTLLFTAPGDRVMRPQYGCRVHSMPFRPPGEERAALVKYYVRESLRAFEPDLQSMQVELSRQDQESTTIHIQGRSGLDGQSLSVLVTFEHEPSDD